MLHPHPTTLPLLRRLRSGALTALFLFAQVAFGQHGLEHDGGVAERPEAYPATYHENPSPLVFRVPAFGKSARERARAATEALTAALDATDVDHTPTVRIEGGVAVVRVGDARVARLIDADAAAEEMRLQEYAPHLEALLLAFVPSQLKRNAVQLFTLHLFLAVFFGVLGFVTLRGVRTAFDQWDAALEERKATLAPIAILRVPILGAEALAGALAFGLGLGRYVAYLTTLVASLAAVLSSFDGTRPLLKRIATSATVPLVNGGEAVLRALPGILLAILLAVVLRAALRVLNLLLDSVQQGRIHSRRISPERVPVLRVAASVAAFLLLFPLLVALAFGRFGTPLETLALAGGGMVLLAAVPLVASYLVGTVMLWQQQIQPGDWVQCGEVSGEVISLSLGEISLVPSGGGRVSVPMIFLLLHPVRRLHSPPAVSFEITVARDRPGKELLAAMREAVKSQEEEADVECIDLCKEWLRIRVHAPSTRTGVREQLLLAVSDAVDAHRFELPTLHGPARDAP